MDPFWFLDGPDSGSKLRKEIFLFLYRHTRCSTLYVTKMTRGQTLGCNYKTISSKMTIIKLEYPSCIQDPRNSTTVQDSTIINSYNTGI